MAARGESAAGNDLPPRIAVAALHLIGLVLLGLHIYVRSLPPTPEPLPAPDHAEAYWWGLWPATYVPSAWFWTGVVLVLALMGWSWWWLCQPPPHPASQASQASQDNRRRSLFWGSVISIVLVIAFFTLPIAHTRWGDAYILSRAISWPDPALRLTHSWQAPLDVYLHSQVWLRGHEVWGWQDAVPVYQLLSPLAGIIYLGALLAFSASRQFAPAWLTYGLLASLGVIQLFFGYIENYSFAAAGILAFLWLGHRVLQARAPLWLAASVLALTNATHPSTVVLAPALLYLGWQVYAYRSTQSRGTRTGWHNVLLTGVEIALPMLVIASGTLWLMESGGHGLAVWQTTDRPGGSDASWFVPLWATQTRWQAYTLLSWPHVRDLLNQQALVAPVVLPSLIWLGLWGKWARQGQDDGNGPTRRFVAIAALAYLLLTVIWNPDYGGQRDWDLFSLASIAAALWLALVAQQQLGQHLGQKRVLVAGFAPLLALQILHVMAWVYQNTLPWDWP